MKRAAPKKKKIPARKPAKKRRTAAAPAQPAGACDMCGAEVREVHCRLVCPHCGAMRDCSDP